MEKNVSGVDLEELLKAREELDRERGVTTDPNLYSDYNSNKDTSSESQVEEVVENFNDYNNITDNSNSNEPEVSIESNESSVSNENSEPNEPSVPSEHDAENDDLASLIEQLEQPQNEESPRVIDEQSSNRDNTTSEDEPVVEQYGVSQSNLSKFDNFSAFEVKENAPVPEVSNENTVTNESSEEQSRTVEEITSPKEDVVSNNNEITLENKMTDSEIDSRLEKIENVDELENLLSDLLDELDEDDDEIEENPDTNLTNLYSLDEEDENLDVITKQEESEDTENVDGNFLTGIDIEPKFDDEVKLDEENLNSDSEVNTLKEDISENILETKENVISLDSVALEHISEEPAKETEEIKTEGLNDLPVEDEKAEEINENLAENHETEDEEVGEIQKESDEDDESNIDTEIAEETDTEVKETESSADLEETDETEQAEDEVPDLGEDYINSLLNVPSDPAPVSKQTNRTVYAENSVPENDVEVITDYSQLRDILQKQLKESEEIDKSEFKKKYSFKEIDDFKFIDEIASDDFKEADKFSYILGKNENNEMIYGNFKEHCNLGVFGRNETVVNSLLNSMILSLCLKNNFNDVNFVLLDSDINSPFEVYNKSSYLYFNRIAKTNKEILDTLIEVSKEVDNRYSKLAGLGVKNIDSYNESAVDGGMQTMPYIILVFNNYTSASQATDHDRINACLYQILKFGRITGVYAVVSAKLPIDVNQINYSLSSRLSFKSDVDSTYTVGAEGIEFLPGESDALYYNIASNMTEHIKVANVTEMELDLIIKDLEE